MTRLLNCRGPKCFCARGREPSQKNDTVCVDQDECDIFGICDQKCTNLEDSYFCDCDSAGYELFDGSHCRAVNVPRSGESVIFVHKDQD